jgi:hypothetical protein
MHFYLYDHFKSDNELRHGVNYGKHRHSASDWSVGKTVKKFLLQLGFWLVGGKTVKKIKKFFTVFPTDQSEAELLYFYSLFFSVKSRLKKQTAFS